MLNSSSPCHSNENNILCLGSACRDGAMLLEAGVYIQMASRERGSLRKHWTFCSAWKLCGSVIWSLLWVAEETLHFLYIGPRKPLREFSFLFSSYFCVGRFEAQINCCHWTNMTQFHIYLWIGIAIALFEMKKPMLIRILSTWRAQLYMSVKI